MRNLYIVATPIGNLKDITLRALEILKEVDVILAEDTRVTRKLLSHYNIRKPIFRYVSSRDFSNFRQIALVTDAGTPAISDPGRKLVKDLSANGFTIIPVPGPSALSAIASVSDINLSEFLFLGFPPHKKGRQKFFQEVADSSHTVVFYESPYRIIKTMKELASNQELKEQSLMIGRELTKKFETIYRGKAEEILGKYSQELERGELVLVVGKY